MGWRILIILLLLVGTVCAQPSDRLDSIRVRCYDRIGVDNSGTSLLPTSLVNRLINTSAWRLCSDFPAREMYDTIYLSSGTVDYDLSERFMAPNYARNYYGAEGDSDSGFVLLTYVENEAAFRAMGGAVASNRVQAAKGPSYYTVTDSIISFLPEPGLTDTVYVSYFAEPDYMHTSSATCGVSPDYLWLLESLVCRDLCRRMGAYAMADQYNSDYERELARGRNEP